MMCRCAYGNPLHMMYAPRSRCVTGSPVAFASKGHMIIQCGPMATGGLVWSNGSESLRWLAPASMYVIPGTVLVGLGFRAAKSAAHCMDGWSAHIGGSPTAFGLPGMQVNPFEPSRKTTVWP